MRTHAGVQARHLAQQEASSTLRKGHACTRRHRKCRFPRMISDHQFEADSPTKPSTLKRNPTGSLEYTDDLRLYFAKAVRKIHWLEIAPTRAGPQGMQCVAI